jgi:hypothetical protein
MSEKTDRGINSGLLLRVVIVFCAVALGAGIYIWWLMSSPSSGNAKTPEAAAQAPRTQAALRDEALNVTLFYYYPADGLLATGFIAVKRQTDTQTQARELLRSLSSDQRASQTALLRDLQVRELFLDTAGTAYIDLVPIQQKDISASIEEEFLSLYAIVNTLMQNFEEIKQVALLIDGKEAQTLAGHIDLSRKFTKRMDLVKP